MSDFKKLQYVVQKDFSFENNNQESRSLQDSFF